MKIDKTIDLFEGLKSRTDKKSEIKIYTKFQKLLVSIKNKGLEENQLTAIEEKLDSLELNSSPQNPRRFFRKKINVLVNFLQKEFSYVQEGYYKSLYMALGMSFGVAIGASIGATAGQSNGIALGLVLGMTIGIVLGQAKDKQSEKKGLVLK
ncbi:MULTISPECIES: hypothetical protein [unclassified Lentimicrobium]|uniref:hypothetical protein n=1 Tax=unclassified Lentimicrobium TaxID=2677434 RepID=UPI001557D618|nr:MULTISPECIES: hypothetical protein [unclassified Lentimicrobium]NPD47096.1 hypothetical protein [Lentimicrobium sp. S6]NPD85744.1 hypothetical protein [Lentimicrobium sp. L6]